MAMIVVHVIVMIVVMITDATLLGIDAGAAEIEMTSHLVLVLDEHVGTDGGAALEIAAAVEVLRVVDAAAAVVERGRRIGTERAGASGRAGRGTLRSQRVRCDAMLDPIDQRAERIDRDRPDATAAMADAGRAEQAIEALQLLEVRLVAVAVARRHLA